MRMDDHPTVATRREWVGLGVLALPCMVVSMDATVLNLAVPLLVVDLRPSGSELLWVVDSYAFVVAALLIPMGIVADRFGPRRLLLTGAALFGAASVLATYAGQVELLIAARILLGAAGATLMPSTLSLIRQMFRDPEQRRTALGLWTASFAVGGLVGPLVGGLLLERFGWRSVFLVAVPVMLLLLAAGRALLPELRRSGRQPIDGLSAALSLGAVLAVVYGLKQAAESGPDTHSVLAVAVGLVLGGLFFHRQRRPDPVLDPALFRRPLFTVPLAANTLAFFALYGTQLLTAQYMQLVLGLSPLQAGLLTIPGTVAFLLTSLIAPPITNRLTAPPALTISLLITATGLGIMTHAGTEGPWPVVTGSVVFSIGLAPVYFLAADLTVAVSPPSRAGSAAAILESGAELGGAFGIAVLGSTVGIAYRHTIADSLPPTMPSELRETAQRTLGGVASVAERLPAAVGADLMDSARAAFLHGFRLAGIITTTLMIGSAITAAVTLHRHRPEGHRRPKRLAQQHGGSPTPRTQRRGCDHTAPPEDADRAQILS
ncbi:MFS transporter [Kribbella swartbergensis]